MTKVETTFYSDDSIKSKTYIENGFFHREGDLPAVLEYYPEGELKRERWYRQGKFHRLNDQPSQIDYSKDGKIIGKIWAVNGINLREGDQGSSITLNPNGNKMLEVFFHEGKMIYTKFYPDKDDESIFEQGRL